MHSNVTALPMSAGVPIRRIGVQPLRAARTGGLGLGLAIVRHLVELHGGVVRATSEGTDRGATFTVRPPDVLVTDIGMPGEDSYALIRKIRARAPEHGGRVPAAALTAYARVEDRMRALSAGFQLHVPKPVEPAELATVVATLAGRTDPESSRGD
jgi:CheY-like chemotaxis protein